MGRGVESSMASWYTMFQLTRSLLKIRMERLGYDRITRLQFPTVAVSTRSVDDCGSSWYTTSMLTVFLVGCVGIGACREVEFVSAICRFWHAVSNVSVAATMRGTP